MRYYGARVESCSLECLAQIRENVGEGQFVCEAVLWMNWVHVGTLVAVRQCSVLLVNAMAFLQVVQRGSPLLRYITKEYVIAFHSRVVALSPPVNLPTDIAVPFTDFETLVRLMPHSARVVIGFAVLDRHFGSAAGYRGWTRAIITRRRSKLMDEVNVGKSVIVEDAAGFVRVVFVSAMHVQCFDGRILVQLGTWDGKQMRPEGLLPAKVQGHMETSQQTVGRLIDEEFASLRAHLQIQREESHLEVHVSSRLGVRTKYLRTAYHFQQIRDPTLLEAHVAPFFIPRSEARRGSFRGNAFMGNILSRADTSIYDMEYGLSSDTLLRSVGRPMLRLYTWMTSQAFVELRTGTGQKRLQRFIRSLDIDQDVVAEVNSLDLDSPTRAPFVTLVSL